MLAAALAAFTLYLLVLALAAYIATHPPRSPIFLSPAALGAPMEEVEFPSRDGTPLSGWWVPSENARGVAILLHGYVMNRSE
ncbi:MAG: alpha/beta hydrolase, partial [Armatimonadota bacterium]